MSRCVTSACNVNKRIREEDKKNEKNEREDSTLVQRKRHTCKKKHQEAYGHRLGMAHGVELAFVLLVGFFVGVPQFCILVVVVAN